MLCRTCPPKNPQPLLQVLLTTLLFAAPACRSTAPAQGSFEGVPAFAWQEADDDTIADVDETAAGERTFDVYLQGRPVLSNFDIVAETGAPNRSLRKEFRGIRAGGELRIDMVQQSGPTLLCGVELVAEDGAADVPIR